MNTAKCWSHWCTPLDNILLGLWQMKKLMSVFFNHWLWISTEYLSMKWMNANHADITAHDTHTHTLVIMKNNATYFPWPSRWIWNQQVYCFSSGRCSTGVGGNYVMNETSTLADIILFIQNKSLNNPLKFGRWFMGYSAYLETLNE